MERVPSIILPFENYSSKEEEGNSITTRPASAILPVFYIPPTLTTPLRVTEDAQITSQSAKRSCERKLNEIVILYRIINYLQRRIPECEARNNKSKFNKMKE
nr:9553_t:CDS:2 [Entrophospora candida]